MVAQPQPLIDRGLQNHHFENYDFIVGQVDDFKILSGEKGAPTLTLPVSLDFIEIWFLQAAICDYCMWCSVFS